MNDVDRKVGQIIQRRRRGLGMTQTQLGEKIGVHHSTIACYENGFRGMTLDTFFQICDILHLDPNEIQKQISD